MLLSSTINPVESSPDTPTVRVLFSGSETEKVAISIVFSEWEYEVCKSLITGGLLTSKTVILISSLVVVKDPSDTVILSL